METINTATAKKPGPLLFRIMAAVQIIALLILLRMSHILHFEGAGTTLAVTWPWLRYVLVAFALYSIGLSFFIVKLMRPALEKMEAAGRDREFTELLVLYGMSAGPGMGAFIFFAVGGSRMDFQLWGTVSLGLLSYWTWMYRHRFRGGT